MTPSKELVALLFELERAASPLERLQIIARAWRSVRALDGFERRDLARRVGFDGAEELIDRLASKGGLAPATLLEALRRARRADPAQLRGILAGLRTPGSRGQATLEGLQLAESMLGPDEPEPVQPDEVAQEDAPASPSAVWDPRSAEVPAADSDTLPDLPEVLVAAPRPAPLPAPQPASRRMPEPPAPAVQSAPRAAPSVPTARRRGRTQAPAPAPMPAAPEAAEVAPPPGAKEPPLRALRQLEARLEGSAEPDAGELEGIVLGLPDGWVRRRAVLALLRHGLPRRIPEALRMVEGLGWQRDRTWVLAVLLDDRSLAASELEQALALITSESARGRLRRRASGTAHDS